MRVLLKEINGSQWKKKAVKDMGFLKIPYILHSLQVNMVRRNCENVQIRNYLKLTFEEM